MKKGKYRKNPKTNDLFAVGDIRDDGYKFVAYKTSILKNGYFGEKWCSPRPSTGKERSNKEGKKFKNGDVREDGKIFWGYDRSKILKNGYYGETWLKTKKEGFKRINPITDQPFKQGDVDNRGMIFCHYHLKVVRKDGSFRENWITKETYKKRLESNKQYKSKKHAEGLREPGIKRLNPLTSKPFKLGDRRDDGAFFIQYRQQIVNEDGYCQESWVLNYDSYHRFRVKNILANARLRNKKRHNRDDFNLDIDFLLNIYPKDKKCPILNVEMEWSSKGHDISPSLDRVDPKKGYTKDNVMWMSRKANTMKSNASTKELQNFAKWVKPNE